MGHRNWLWVSMLVLALVGCDLIGGGDGGTPTPPGQSGNQLVYTAPYRAVLNAGDSVPGAQLQYVEQTDDGITVRIDGQEATKKVGDSFNWRGAVAPGVELNYKLRVMGVYVGVFQAWGEVEILVADPAPLVADPPAEAPFVFNAVVVNYTVPQGEAIPGTTYTYLGNTDKGAEFGGLDGYAFRAPADSLDWDGQIRSNVFADLKMRVTAVRDEEVTLLGTATVWVLR